MKTHTLLSRISLFGIIVFIGLCMACAGRPTPEVSADITGAWKADIDSPQGRLEIILNITESTEGTYTATMDVPTMGYYDIELVFSYENNVVHYEIPGGYGTFEGKLSDPSTLEGTSSSMGGENYEVTYKRVD